MKFCKYFIFFSLIFLWSSFSEACTCSSGSAKGLYDLSSWVFVGTVKDVVYIDEDRNDIEPRIKVTFDIETEWKNLFKASELNTVYNKASCRGYWFGKGKRYLIFSETKFSGQDVKLCSVFAYPYDILDRSYELAKITNQQLPLWPDPIKVKSYFSSLPDTEYELSRNTDEIDPKCFDAYKWLTQQWVQTEKGLLTMAPTSFKLKKMGRDSKIQECQHGSCMMVTFDSYKEGRWKKCSLILVIDTLTVLANPECNDI